MSDRMLALTQIGYEPRYYPRVNGYEDWMTVHRYRDALAADPGMEFPHVTVVAAPSKKYEFMLLDGKHRCKAYSLAGRNRVPATIERLPESKWFARSVELNATHGRALDSGDKAWIAKRLEEDGWTLDQAAKLLNMRPESLEKIKANHVVKVRASVAKKLTAGRACRKIGEHSFGFLKAPFKEFAGSAAASDVLAVQGRVAARTCVQVLGQAIAVLEAGVDMSDEDIVERVERIRQLLPEPALA